MDSDNPKRKDRRDHVCFSSGMVMLDGGRGRRGREAYGWRVDNGDGAYAPKRERI